MLNECVNLKLLTYSKYTNVNIIMYFMTFSFLLEGWGCFYIILKEFNYLKGEFI